MQYLTIKPAAKHKILVRYISKQQLGVKGFDSENNIIGVSQVLVNRLKSTVVKID